MLAITQHSEPKSSRQCKGAVIILINVMISERAPTMSRVVVILIDIII